MEDIVTGDELRTRISHISLFDRLVQVISLKGMNMFVIPKKESPTKNMKGELLGKAILTVTTIVPIRKMNNARASSSRPALQEVQIRTTFNFVSAFCTYDTPEC